MNIMDYSLLIAVYECKKHDKIELIVRQKAHDSLHLAYLFRYNHGGLEDINNGRIFLFGMIDILHEYNAKKVIERNLKRINNDIQQVSVASPKESKDILKTLHKLHFNVGLLCQGPGLYTHLFKNSSPTNTLSKMASNVSNCGQIAIAVFITFDI